MPHRLLIVILLSFTLFTLRSFVRRERAAEVSAHPPAQVVASAADEAALLAAVERLLITGPADAPRLATLHQVEAWQGLSPATGAALLRAATRIYAPSMDKNEAARQAYSQLLVTHAQSLPLATVQELLPTAAPPVRQFFLKVLAASDSLRASKLLAQLLQGGLSQEEARHVAMLLSQRPHHPAILLPPVLARLADSHSDSDSYSDSIVDQVLLTYAHAGLLPKQTAQAARAGVLQRYQAASAAPDGAPVMGLLLHLFAYLPADWSAPQVESALLHTHDEVVLYALHARLMHGGNLPPVLVARVAANNSTRARLLHSLQEHDRLDLCPAQYTTEVARAEGNLVDWLLYPTELGEAPEAIELVQGVQLKETPDRTYYVFRFRSSDPNAGWMAGFSAVDGPRAAEDPGPGFGPTFSSLAPMASKTPEEHVRTALALFAERLAAEGAADAAGNRFDG